MIFWGTWGCMAKKYHEKNCKLTLLILRVKLLNLLLIDTGETQWLYYTVTLIGILSWPNAQQDRSRPIYAFKSE